MTWPFTLSGLGLTQNISQRSGLSVSQILSTDIMTTACAVTLIWIMTLSFWEAGAGKSLASFLIKIMRDTKGRGLTAPPIS